MENGKFPALFFLVVDLFQGIYNEVCEETEYNHQYFINSSSLKNVVIYCYSVI